MKHFLTTEQQLKRLKEDKKMKTREGQNNEILESLESNNYVYFFTSFKPVFAEMKTQEEIDWNEVREDWKDKDKHYNFFKILYKRDENNGHIYKSWFSFDKLKTFNENNEAFSEFLLNNILKLERRMKSVLARQIAQLMHDSENPYWRDNYDKWLDFLETIWVDKDEFQRFKKGIKSFSNPIWFDIEFFTFGDLKFLLLNFLNSNTSLITNVNKRKIETILFKRIIGYQKTKMTISFALKVRNFLAHSKNIQYFYQLEINKILLKESKKDEFIIKIKTYDKHNYLYNLWIDKGVIPYAFDFLVTKKEKSVNNMIIKGFQNLISCF
ncbi:hypothetical protein [Mycoplasma procyoni]|uniref:hypothetical protein n=1 Tax=Mycoplasma procyoni TaxID=568784 RepID=UPI00197B560A|nr:hypothetical protein [Mycoplasma procyoni]MBN3535047.1 hypothetical protein [Mycoplasma procyoni]